MLYKFKYYEIKYLYGQGDVVWIQKNLETLT